MQHTIEAVFDGEVFRPDTKPDLEPNKRYTLTVEEPKAEEHADNAWAYLRSIAGTVEMPEDWSAEHDHYLYGGPKRHAKE
jgi:hypothetical protein